MFSDSVDQPSAHGGDRAWDVSFRSLDQRSAAAPASVSRDGRGSTRTRTRANREESHSRVPSRQLIVRHARARSPSSLSGIESEVSRWPFFGARPDRCPGIRATKVCCGCSARKPKAAFFRHQRRRLSADARSEQPRSKSLASMLELWAQDWCRQPYLDLV
jgi:hypothetical protein